MRRHVHRWRKVRGLHVASEHEFCEFKSRGHRCKAKRGYQDWNSCDQALWLTSLLIARNLDSKDWEFDAYLFFGLWIRSLLDGE